MDPLRTPDVTRERRGRLMLFHAHTAEARRWFQAFQPDAERWGSAYAVACHSAPEISQRLIDHGLTVK
jgi:hypothetical protein